ncbi:MAG: hypothetical protein SFV54_09350 [Bryobacteraceae bacterium]|nr:hypothetical protein [Bryobacteraceae bacterium]
MAHKTARWAVAVLVPLALLAPPVSFADDNGRGRGRGWGVNRDRGGWNDRSVWERDRPDDWRRDRDRDWDRYRDQDWRYRTDSKEARKAMKEREKARRKALKEWEKEQRQRYRQSRNDDWRYDRYPYPW